MRFFYIVLVIGLLLLQSCLCDKVVTVQYEIKIINTTSSAVEFSAGEKINSLFAPGIVRVSIPSGGDWYYSWSVTDVAPFWCAPPELGVLVDGASYYLNLESVVFSNPCKTGNYTFSNDGIITHIEYEITDLFLDSCSKLEPKEQVTS